MAKKKMPVIHRAKPEITKMGKPKGERQSKSDGGPVGQPSTPLNVSPRMRGTRQRVQPAFYGGAVNLNPEVE